MDTTEEPAYDIAVTLMAMGQVPACVPVHYEGQDCVYTNSGTIDLSLIRTDDEALALAILAIMRAHQEAERAGARPIR